MKERSQPPSLLEPEATAGRIFAAFDGYREEFKLLTRRAHRRFDSRDWHGFQSDSSQRLDIYSRFSRAAVLDLEAEGVTGAHARASWTPIKEAYSARTRDRDDRELAETFFNSVTRKFFHLVGVDPQLEFATRDRHATSRRSAHPVFTRHAVRSISPPLIARILRSYSFDTPFFDLERDTMMVTGAIDAHLSRGGGDVIVDGLDIATSLFYRNKSAYIIGRIHRGGRVTPLVLPLLNTDIGIIVDTVLLDEDDASILFSFTRSYFHVEAEAPRDLIQFLKSIMPIKPVAELYISIGHDKHGKTELYSELVRQLAASTDKFEFARGDKGMVMVVFTLPSYDVVFKVIRDIFAYPKTTVRHQVMEKYNLVFKHDRAGRLVDAQEFEYLSFDRARFTDALLDELRTQASQSVTVEGDRVVIAHMYMERRLAPLNLFLREAASGAARSAVIDYGQTVKDLAATNIFPGDLLLKNFGVTRHGRVVFYDYDELCLLSDCNFRTMPRATDHADEMQAEPWFFVAENDVFPEEFIHFLGLKGELRDAFLGAHADILNASFWTNMQERLDAGEILDLFPYRQEQRFPSLRRNRA